MTTMIPSPKQLFIFNIILLTFPLLHSASAVAPLSPLVTANQYQYQKPWQQPRSRSCTPSAFQPVPLPLKHHHHHHHENDNEHLKHRYTTAKMHSVGPSVALTTQSRSLHSLHLLRGGAILPPLLESITPPSPNTILLLAELLSTYIFISGSFLLVAPVTYTQHFHGIIKNNEIEKDSFESSLLQAIGAIVVGFAIHIYLTLIRQVSVSYSMGYSLLPRIFIILVSFLKTKVGGVAGGRGEEGGEGGKCYEFQGSNFLKVNFAMMSWTAFALLTNTGNPNVSTKLFSTMALVKAMALITNPVKMTKKLFSVDVSGEAMSTARFLSRALGNYLAISAILMLSLALGVNPVLAVGISFGVWFALLLDMAFLTKAWKWIGEESYTQKQMFHMLVSLIATFMFFAGSKF